MQKIDDLKQRANIAILIISFLMLMFLPLIPHHHHHGVACLVSEHLHTHEGHSGPCKTSENPDSQSSCIEDAEYIHPQKVQKAKAPVEHFDSNFIVPFILYQYDLLCRAEGITTELHCDDYLLANNGIEYIASNGLRAPPSTFLF